MVESQAGFGAAGRGLDAILIVGVTENQLKGISIKETAHPLKLNRLAQFEISAETAAEEQLLDDSLGFFGRFQPVFQPRNLLVIAHRFEEDCEMVSGNRDGCRASLMEMVRFS